MASVYRQKGIQCGFAAAAKRITGGRKEKYGAAGTKKAEAEEAEATKAEAANVEAEKAEEASAKKASAKKMETPTPESRSVANSCEVHGPAGWELCERRLCTYL